MEQNTQETLLRNAFESARQAKLAGNLPYGCVLADESGNIIMDGRNTVITDKDALGHAEINLIREASKKYDAEFLKKCTIFTSDEPCPMCASAIFWGGIGSLVFGLSKARFYQEFGRDNPDIDFDLSSRTVLQAGARKVKVIGPLLEEEALALHSE